MSDEITDNSAGAETATTVEGDTATDDGSPIDVAGPVEVVEIGEATAADENAESTEVDATAEVGAPATSPEEAEPIASVENAAPTQVAEAREDVKPAGSKTEGKADGSGPKGAGKQDGSKAPKKPKKKSSKPKPHAGETAGSGKSPPPAVSEKDTAPTEPAEAAGTEQAGERRRSLQRLLSHSFVTVILGVIAIGLAVGFVLTTLQLSDSNNLVSARTSAIAAAKTYSVDLAGYDYRHLDQDFGVVLSHSTPSFRRSFTQSSNALKSTLLKYHASAAAKVVAAGLVSASTNQAVALVFLDQTVTNSTQKSPTTDRSQVEITLVRTGGTWLINQVTLL